MSAPLLGLALICDELGKKAGHIAQSTQFLGAARKEPTARLAEHLGQLAKEAEAFAALARAGEKTIQNLRNREPGRATR